MNSRKTRKSKVRHVHRAAPSAGFTAYGKIPGVVEIDSSRAKSGFSRVLRHVKNGGAVAIKLHNEHVGMFVPMDEYERLRQANARKLDLLTRQFDDLVRSMQSPDFAPKARKAFGEMAERAPMAAVIAAANAARHG